MHVDAIEVGYKKQEALQRLGYRIMRLLLATESNCINVSLKETNTMTDEYEKMKAHFEEGTQEYRYEIKVSPVLFEKIAVFPEITPLKFIRTNKFQKFILRLIGLKTFS